MEIKDAILYNLQSSRFVMSSYLSDLSDEELLVRPVPAAHHAAWQLGHLILSEYQMARGIAPDVHIDISSDFVTKHDKDAAARNDASSFCSKDVYCTLMSRVREATVAALSGCSEDDLARPGPEAMRSYAPTCAAVFLAIANHEMMHAGQIAVLRRALGKPIVI